jgi:hypothetical protein
VSQTKPVTYRDCGLWAHYLVLGVFLKYLIDVVEATGQADTPFLAEAVSSWRIAPIYDFGIVFEESWTPLQRQNVTTFAEQACERLGTRESIPLEEVAGWPFSGYKPVFGHGLKEIRTAPAIELGRAIIALLRDELPEPPRGEAWFFTHEGRSTIRMDPSWNGRWGFSAALEGKPLFKDGKPFKRD